MPRYFNLPHSKVGNVNINWTSFSFFVFSDPVDAMYATAYLFLVVLTKTTQHEVILLPFVFKNCYIHRVTYF